MKADNVVLTIKLFTRYILLLFVEACIYIYLIECVYFLNIEFTDKFLIMY